jgi:hypothetical protein
MKRTTKKKHPLRIKRSEAFLGIHFDFHAGMDCTEVGKALTRKMLREMLESVKPDYVQCDCKGHSGIASYPTTVGTPAPGFVRDPLKLWREVTAECGVSLYLHYSGVVDEAAVKQHPDWAARQPNGEPWDGVTSVFGPYVDELMIPMFKELVDVYGIDGVWVDGECWGAEMDYSDHARKAWKAATGLDEMPVARGDKHFERFREFQREGFRTYLAHYIDEMHAYAPGFEIASNWAYTAHMPEPVGVDMDFISGDVTPQNALAQSLMDARVLSLQGKPWDLMSWAFNGKWGAKAQSTKSAIQLQQEAAVVMASGGGYQAYFQQKRDASFSAWPMGVMAEVAQFCRKRQPYCQGGTPVPQIGLILSRDGYYRQIDELMRPWEGVYQGMRGVLCNLLDSQNVVDVVMDHHLEETIERYALLVLPEWTIMAPALKRRLLAYVHGGGKLLLIGTAPTRTFRKELKLTLKGKAREMARYAEVDGRMGGFLTDMQEVVPQRGAKVHSWLYEGNEAKGPRIPAAVITTLGKGEIAAVTMNMGERYGSGRTTVARDFVQSLVRRLMRDPMVEVTGSHKVAVTLMRKDESLLLHLVNTGGEHHGGCYTFDEIPPVGPLEVTVRLEAPPRSVKLLPGNRRLKWSFDQGLLSLHIPRVELHDIVEISFEYCEKRRVK